MFPPHRITSELFIRLISLVQLSLPIPIFLPLSYAIYPRKGRTDQSSILKIIRETYAQNSTDRIRL